MVKIGLCLSGGGARGAAHVGVIRALKEHDVKIHAVSGASAGSIVGALYCAGIDEATIIAFLKQGSLFRTLKFGIPDRGIGDLAFLRKQLKKHLPVSTFEELETKLFVTATNLSKGKTQVFESGELLEPIVASSAIPLAFSPIQIDDQIYVDGGVMDNLPVDPLLNQSDYIIGVNLIPSLEVGPKSLQSLRGVMGRTFDLGIIANTRPNLGKCNAVISPMKLYKYNIFNFGKVEEMEEIGYESAIQMLDVILSQLTAIQPLDS